MTDDRLAHVEQQLARLSEELRQTRRQLRMVQGRSRRMARRAWLLGTVGLVAALAIGTVGTTTAAPRAQPLTVRAPFRVVDGSGAVLLEVNKNGLMLYGRGITVWDNGDAGGYSAMTGHSIGLLHGSASALLGEEVGALALRFYQRTADPHNKGLSGHYVAAIGETSSGGRLILRNGERNPIVDAGSSLTGGIVNVYDRSGRIRTQDTIDAEGNGVFGILNGAGTSVAALAEHTQGGYLGLADQGGNAMVEAGVSGGVGVVRAYPEGGMNWFIKGKQ